MIDKSKVDSELGQSIHEYLKEMGVETPFHSIKRPGHKKAIENHFKSIMELLGLDLTDDSLERTPYRVAKMFVDEVYWGLDIHNFPKIMTIENKMNYDQMIIERNVSVKSACEHHFQPFVGVAHIAYIPKKRVVGLSKLNRVVEYFSRRPQVQERLTEQIFHSLSYLLGTDDIAVIIKAQHMCVTLRGVEDDNSETITSKMGGVFLNGDDIARQEFLTSIKL